jgi:type IV secretory pathway TrbD component
MGLVMAGLTIGILLMGIQLWLLTIALELYLAGHGERVWLVALISGAIFAGGLFMLRLLRRRPQIRRTGQQIPDRPMEH